MPKPTPPLYQWALLTCLLLLLFTTRLHNLTALPLHNDEGLHLTRARAVWDGFPFWDISDGKIINHWLIAAFYPQNAPDFVARVPTIFVAVIGAAAGYALVRHVFGGRAALWGVLLWVLSPYLFFYERLAQSDPEAGALAVVAVWAALLLAERGAVRWAVITGGALALATLMKFTAAPFALTVLLIVLFVGDAPLVVRVRNLFVIGVTGAAFVALPMLYLLLSGRGFFTIALGWLNDGGATPGLFRYNTGIFLTNLSGFGVGGGLWAALVGGGLAAVIVRGGWRALRLLAFVSVPPLLVIAVSSTIYPRHFVGALPLLLLLSGAGWGLLVGRRRVLAAALVMLLAAHAGAFMWAAYTQPDDLRLPTLARMEYVETHSAGFGLRDAAADMPALIPPDAPIVASMFPASCRRTNFYLPPTHQMQCVDAPGADTIARALETDGAVFVLVEQSPGIGITTLESAERLRHYPRPGGLSAVSLYRVAAGQPAAFSPQ